MNQKGNSLIIILLGILILALIGGAYYLGTQKSQIQPVTTVTNVQLETQISPTPILDSNNTWKTYENDGVKFSIQYPQDWSLTEQKAPVGYNPVQFPGGISRVDIKGAQGSISILWGGGFGGGPCPQTHYQLQTSAGLMDFCDSKHSDNSELLVMSNDGPSNAVSENSITTFKIGSNINSPYKTNQDEILKILSTFKFTDQNQQSSVSTGIVTGKLCYPSSVLPKGQIIAKSVTTGEIFSQDYPGSMNGGGQTYSMQLKPDTYHLNYTVSSNLKGYYTDYSSCADTPTFEGANCSGQITRPLLPVNITSGNTTQDINLCDFYYPPNNPPQF